MSRLPLRSLRARLTALIAAVVVLAVGAIFIATYRGTGAQLRDQIDRELRNDAAAFARSAVPPGVKSANDVEARARNYLANQPFRASSRLLFLELPGRAPVTNEPELLAAEHELRETRVGYSSVSLQDAGRLRLYRETVLRPGIAPVTVAIGEPLSPVERAQHEVARTFALWGGITLVIALLVGAVSASRVSRPLRRMARIAARVDGGDLSPRMETPSSASEVRQLADSFDTMLDRLEDAFARQRAFASDASHELRTPLTVIRGQLEVLARTPNPATSDVRRVERLVSTEILRMERLVEDLLVLARADEREFLRCRKLDLAPFLSDIVDGFRATADRQFELAGGLTGVLDVDPDRLAQALRNLIRNAIEHTSDGGIVRVVAGSRGNRVLIAVEDDGRGIPPEQRERVFDRFHRIDISRTRTRGGAGLGLAIVRAIVEAHGGAVRAGESPEGGARVEIELPGFAPGGTPAPQAPAVSSSA